MVWLSHTHNHWMRAGGYRDATGAAPNGIIIGAVLGGALLLLVFAGVILWRCRTRAASKTAKQHPTPTSTHTVVASNPSSSTTPPDYDNEAGDAHVAIVLSVERNHTPSPQQHAKPALFQPPSNASTAHSNSQHAASHLDHQQQPDAAASGTTDVTALLDERCLSQLLIPWSDIQLAEQPLGRGGFGAVYRGSWQGMKVAVKMLEGSALRTLLT
jgi:hypothetical protein